MDHDQVLQATRRWVQSSVVDLNLCPFAKREFVNDRVRFTVSDATSEGQLLGVLRDELELLMGDPNIETTLLVHPQVLQQFGDYNQFLDAADRLLVKRCLAGIYQVASFHPDYQFAGTDPDDAENYTNRSPYPMLHLLSEASVARVVQDYPDIDQIPMRNIERMKKIGTADLRASLRACFEGD